MAVNNVTETKIEESTHSTFIEWDGTNMTEQAYNEKLAELASSSSNYKINQISNEDNIFNQLAGSMCGVFGMPYQFSKIVDPCIENTALKLGSVDWDDIEEYESNIGRKYAEKIFSVAPIIFLTPGEPRFMAGYGKQAKINIANRLMSTASGLLGDEDGGAEYDDGKYYSFESNFPEYKKYANVALRTLANFMGIGDVEVPVPGEDKGETVVLKNIDVEKFMNNNLTKLFGTQCVVPFYLDAENSISESFDNSTTESTISQTANGFGQSAREIQFIMGSKDFGGALGAIGNALVNLGESAAEVLGSLGEGLLGDNLITRLTKELTTIVSGGKIVFPEVWSDSEYNKSFDISLKLRSPDPDPVSIYLNIYLPIILLISMAAPRQLGNSANSIQSPFLVRATYKSMFNCDLGIISSLSISKGGPGNWNVLGMPTSADVTISLKDLYSSMSISKRMGIVNNTAQTDYLATLAGIDLNDYEPTRLVKLYLQVLGDTPRDWANTFWGGFKRQLNIGASRILSVVSDTRPLGL